MARVELPLIGPAYKNRELPLSAQVTKNLWPEINPEARNVVALHNAAGIRVFSNPGGADRGSHDFNNLGYWVMGNTLWSVDADGVNLSLGTIEGAARTIMADDGQQLIIVTGDKPYRYTVSGGVEEITDPDLVKPTSVAYINQQFIFDQNDGIFGEFVTSSIEPGLSIDALDFAIAESHPDDIIRVLAFRQLIYFFGSHSVEPWSNTGVGNPPWSRVDSGIQLYGLAGTHGVIATSKFMYFLDNRRIPRRSSGLDFINIGTPALGVEFNKYSKIDDVIVFEFVQDNQQFVAFTFPTADRTWVFHEPSGSWFQLSNGIDDARHRASSMLNIYGLNYCADHTNGLIYEYSLDIYSDNGNAIIKQRDTAVIHGGLFEAPGKKIEFNMVEFIIVSGQTEVAGTGLGPQPIVDSRGLCGSTSDLTQGQLLNVGGISLVDINGSSITETAPAANNVNMDNSKVFGFTCAFTREFSPDPTFIIDALDIYDTTNTRSNLTFHMDSDGYMNIIGLNEAGTIILDVQFTNNGSTFADSELHFFSMVIDLSDISKREVFHNALNIGESTWTTWNTYTDDTLQLKDEAGHSMLYSFGRGQLSTGWGTNDPDTNGTGNGGSGIDAVGYMTFDDSCSLIAGSVWDSQGYVRDPQAWEGWYLVQPLYFFGPSFWKNSGTSAPATYNANNSEKNAETATSDYSDEANMDSSTHHVNQQINLGIAGTTAATGGSDNLPVAPPADPQTEIMAPFWANTGNWIDLSALTQTTFASMFGVAVEDADFDKVVAVNKAALVNTGDAGNRVQIQDSIDADNAALFITDSSGNVVDSMIYDSTPNGDSVLVPTGANYYVVITSDTGNAKIKKWDSSQVSTIGSTAWSDFFGSAFALVDGQTWDSGTSTEIPQAGIAIAITIPATSGSWSVGFESVEITGISGTRTGNLGQVQGAYTTAPTFTWGTGGGLGGGINLAGQDIVMIPGNTYFFNVRNDSPLASGNYMRIKANVKAH